MQTMSEKLRLIADAIERGKEIQWTESDGSWCRYYLGANPITIWENTEYRIKPDKPRSGVVMADMQTPAMAYEAVELTPEVRQALEDAGIEI